MKKLKNSRILITGAGGFIGQHLSKNLSLDNFVFGTLLEGENNEFLEKKFVVDISRKIQLNQLTEYQFDHVFHLAGIANIKKSIEAPMRDFEVNAKGTLNMLEFFRASSIKSFTFASSVSVLSSANELPINEFASYGPGTPYGASKMAAESYCMAYQKCYRVPVRIVRLFNVYGPGRVGLVIFDFIKKLLTTPSNLEVLGDGFQVRDFLYVDDAIEGLLKVAINGVDGQIYHLGSGEPVEIRSLAEILLEIMGTSDAALTFTDEQYDGEFLKWFADTSKIKSLGYESKTSLKEGLAKTIEWVKNNS